jgi:putative (di)nucleoside polyphosphate hydrolase
MRRATLAETADPTALPYRDGVGIMLTNAHGRVFVGQRIDWHLDAWQMPQGGVDEGEDWEAAAFRELTEETGIVPELASIMARTDEPLFYELPEGLRHKVWKGRYRGQRQHWYLMRFSGTDADVNIATEHPEFNAWKWAAVDALGSLIVPFKRELYRQVVATFAPHL